MAEYITDPIDVDPSDIEDEIVEQLQAYWPDWEPDPANLDTQVIRALAQVSASDRQSATAALTSIFRWFGMNLIPNAQPETAVAATSTISVVLSDTAQDRLIPAGTTFGIPVGGDLLGFEVVDDNFISAGSPTTLTGVQVIATVEGTIGNGLSGVLTQVDSLGFISSATFESVTSGGIDEEADNVYLDRLRGLLALQAPRPIIPDDFAVMTLNVPGVARAVAIDGYDPNNHASYDPTNTATWTSRMVTVSAVDSSGNDVGATVRSNINSLFNGNVSQGIKALREVNFVVNVVSPVYTSVDVSFTATAWPGWSPTDVQAAAIAALQAYLSPANWGQPQFTEDRTWENLAQLFIDGLYGALRAVPGVRNVNSLTFRNSGYNDQFAADSIGSGALLFDAGSGTLSVSGGQLVPSSTAEKRLYVPNMTLSDPTVSLKVVSGASVASSQWGVTLKRTDASNRISVRQTGTQLLVVKTVAGVDTTLGTPTSVTVPTAATRWVRGFITGNVVTGQLWTTDPALGGSPAATVTYTLTGGDATQFGTGVRGTQGFRVVPTGTDERYDAFVASEAMWAGPLYLNGYPGPTLTTPGAVTGTVS